MAATVQIHEMTAAGTGTDKTDATIRFKSADNTDYDSNDRITIPASGTTYSYTKQLQTYVSVAPDTDLQDLEAYSDGTNSFGTGIGVQYDVLASFTSNVNTDISGTDFFTSDSGSAIDLDANNTGPHTGTGYQGDILRLQMTVADTATQGTLDSEDVTVAYTET